MDGLITRRAEPLVRDLLAHAPGVVVEGAREVGKSTLAAEVAGDGAVSVNLDHEVARRGRARPRRVRPSGR